MSRRVGLVVAALLAIATSAAVGEARADSKDMGADYLEGVSEQLGATGGTMLLRDAPLSASKTPPALADADLRLRGGGSFVGGSVGLLWVTHAFRLSFEETFYGPSGLQMVHGPVGSGLGVSGSKAYGFDLTLGVGRQFHFEGLYPYVEVRGGLSSVALQVSLDAPGLGSVGQNDYRTRRLLLAPRLGIVVPISRAIYLDTSAAWGALGHQGLIVQSMLGFFVFNPSRW